MLFFFSIFSFGQHGDTATANQLKDYVSFFANDSLKGRKNFSSQLHECAKYIAEKFEKCGLRKSILLNAYYQPFSYLQDISNLPQDSLFSHPEKVLFNVIGMLPGKSKPNEVIVFSAHYDHIGTDSFLGKDKIFNGANDNASGVAALLFLANYFSLKNNNERTLAFCAFAGEELGLIGSKVFVNTVNTSSIKVVVNIEMIGKAGVGKNNFFIVGSKYSNLAALMKKSIPKGYTRIVREPPIEKRLFERSDNYPFFLDNVIAHTIMSSYDDDPCYHKPCDETSKIDFDHMARVVSTIALSLEPIINGPEIPVKY